jgi:hypothetical protein
MGCGHGAGRGWSALAGSDALEMRLFDDEMTSSRTRISALQRGVRRNAVPPTRRARSAVAALYGWPSLLFRGGSRPQRESDGKVVKIVGTASATPREEHKRKARVRRSRWRWHYRRRRRPSTAASHGWNALRVLNGSPRIRRRYERESVAPSWHDWHSNWHTEDPKRDG